MNAIAPGNITIDKVNFLPSQQTNISTDVLRLDKIHDNISGNKWFKLQLYFEEAIRQGKNSIITFGGAWSNHIVAAAAACQLYHLNSIGIIRGEKPRQLSATLQQAAQYGMQLHFLSREQYSTREIPPHLVVENHYVIPEGGYGELGRMGAATILDTVDLNSYSHICCAVGTGTMIAGLASAAPQHRVLGLSVLKNNFAIEKSIQSLFGSKDSQIDINHDYHFSGYAKHDLVLIHFMNEFYRINKVPLDFVYTGKLFYGINDLLNRNYFEKDTRLLLIHSGGLQGNLSLQKDVLIF